MAEKSGKPRVKRDRLTVQFERAMAAIAEINGMMSRDPRAESVMTEIRIETEIVLERRARITAALRDVQTKLEGL